MKTLIAILPAVCLSAAPIHAANLLLNGAFTEGADRPDPEVPGNGQLAVNWVQTTEAGWNNRELNVNGIEWPAEPPTDYHLALGNGGPTNNTAYQLVPAVPGLTYRFSVDAGSPDSWWKPNGEVKMEFMDAGGAVISDALTHWVMPDYDVLLPWENYSVTATAPAGTVEINAILSNQGADGGTMRFDNAVLEVVPEPGAAVLLGLGSLLVIGRRVRRDVSQA